MNAAHITETNSRPQVADLSPQLPSPASRPEWIRLAKPGSLCPWTGLSRSKLWEVLQSGKVKHLCLKKPGAQRGARLIHLGSLLSYLESLAETAPAIGSDDGKEGEE